MNNDGQNNPFVENKLTNDSADKPADTVATTEEKTSADPTTIDNDSFPSQFINEPTDTQPETDQPDNTTFEIHWSASESPEHKHGAEWNWMIILIAVAVIIGLIALAMIKFLPLITAISMVVLASLITITMFMVAKRPPRIINYILTEQGVTVAGQLHPFSEYRAFGVHEVGALWELVLLPVKRFGVGNTMFIDEGQGEAIVDTLGARLPMEEVNDTLIDHWSRFMKL